MSFTFSGKGYIALSGSNPEKVYGSITLPDGTQYGGLLRFIDDEEPRRPCALGHNLEDCAICESLTTCARKQTDY